jgi:rhodanese-related sulfurtransferase
MLDWAGEFSGGLLFLGILGFLVARIVRRRVILKNLAAARLEPEELKQWLDAGEPVYIVDLRHPAEPDSFTLPGAHRISLKALAARHQEIPRDRDIVVFCDCPNEATAAKAALTLHKLGIERVRPLRGGYDEWKRLGFPMDAAVAISQS